MRLSVPAPGYKWIALSNTTLGGFMAFLNQTIVLISLPVVFKGLGVNPVGNGQTSLSPVGADELQRGEHDLARDDWAHLG